MKKAHATFRTLLSNNELLLACIVGVALVFVSVSIGWENNKVVPVNSAPSAHYHLEPHNHLSFMSEWDGPIYLSLATHSYTDKIQANFFPLYPLTIHVVHTVIPSLLDSALLISWVCFIGAIFFYLKIIKQLFGAKDNLEALRGALFFLLFPTSIFLMATYTEGLFAFLALGAIYWALRKNYLAAALMAMFATATHVDGIFVVIFIGLYLLEEQVAYLKAAASVVIGSLGLIAYMIYQQVTFHNPLAFIAAQRNHSWVNFSFLHFFSELANLNGLFVLLVLLSAYYWWSRRKSFSIYALLYASIIFIGGKNLGGLGRYTLVAFPLEFMLYDYFRNKKLGYTLAIAASAILWTFFTLRYAGGYTGG